MNSDEQQTLQSLQAEIEALKARVTALESPPLPKSAAQLLPPSSGSHTASIKNRIFGNPQAASPEKVYTPGSNTPYDDRNRLEEYIGGKLLNWIGALIVVFAVAYFLKWSFDNQIIGEMGRCILGLVSGIAFMVIGQFCQNRGFRIYAQGLIGAGIAIIYLSSFAAVNYYHLISPFIAFVLMFITAITGGILSAIDDAPATAIMATVGGFLVPFLMGSHTGRVIPLLSYVLILDLGVLFLAYYRQWLLLDILALIGTAVVSGVAQNLTWLVWPGQAFLTAYLILFIIVAANYNHRTNNHNQILLFFSTVIFAAMSFGNTIDKIGDWRGLFTLSLAVIFLVAYYFPLITDKTTVHFRKWLLVWAIIFALLTAPLHLNNVYCPIAWLAVAAVLLYLAWHFNKRLPFISALVIITAVLFTALGSYVQPYLMPVFNQASSLLILCAIDWLLALIVVPRICPGKIFPLLGLSAVIVSTLFYLVQFDINNAIYYYQSTQSFSFLIPVAWALISTLVLFIGVRRKNKAIRLFSLVLYGVVIVRTLFYDLQQLDIVYKILVLLAIGLIALAISFFYQKRMKGDDLP